MSRRLVLPAVALLAAAMVVGPASPSYAALTWVEIFNRGSGKCLTATGGVGTVIVQMSCDGQTTQMWRQIGLSGSLVEFQNFWSGSCMIEANQLNGAPVRQANCFVYPLYIGETWLLTHVTNIPPAQIAVIQGFDNSCLDLENGDTRDGVPLQVWRCNPNTDNQKWDIYPI